MSEPPLAVALAVSALVLAGAAFTLIGAFGLARLNGFYPRVHAPTLGASLGVVCVSLGSMLHFSFAEGRPVTHEILIVVFMTVTTPVTLMLLARAALYRDRAARRSDAPAQRPRPAESENP